jgi:cytochrome b6-f complex iron-sulfur subunit
MTDNPNGNAEPGTGGPTEPAVPGQPPAPAAAAAGEGATTPPKPTPPKPAAPAAKPPAPPKPTAAAVAASLAAPGAPGRPGAGIPNPGAPKYPAPAPQPLPPKQIGAGRSATPPPKAEVRRRDLVWYAVAAFIVANLVVIARFFFPRTLFEPRTRFRVGYPADYGFGVDTKWQAEQRIWVCRNAEGVFVILAVCPHLGCTPDWKPSENKFKCPCHGSGYDAEGINFEGPAPRPMDRCHVELDPEGQIVVDKARIYQYFDFDKTGAMLRGV